MKLKTYIACLILFSVIAFSCKSNKVLNENAPGLNIHDITTLDSLLLNSDKKAVVFIHTDWCKYCKNMEMTSFKNPEVIDIMNKEFNFISFDAESKKEVLFNNKAYKYVPSGKNTGTHALAESIGRNQEQLVYPTLVIIDREYNILFRHSAYLTGKELKIVLENYR